MPPLKRRLPPRRALALVCTASVHPSQPEYFLTSHLARTLSKRYSKHKNWPCPRNQQFTTCARFSSSYDLHHDYPKELGIGVSAYFSFRDSRSGFNCRLEEYSAHRER